MRAMLLNKLADLAVEPDPLEFATVPVPEPRDCEVLVQVSTCGVCHTELDEIEGRAPPPRLPIILGHEVVGRVVELGSDVRLRHLGERVGVGWIHSSTGDLDENLSARFVATGRDANGGYAEFMTVDERYAFPIPELYSDVEAAPLLCAGAIGYRALRLCNVQDGQHLGLTGFGGSAHLVLQMVRHLLPQTPVFVFARSPEERAFARQLGAAWAGDVSDRAPDRLHAIIDTTPAWGPVVEALANLGPGGRLVINAIRKENTDKARLLDLRYHDHLWMEREIKSVANITGRDIAEFLPLAAAVPLKPSVTTYLLEDANRALRELRRGDVRGATVLLVGAGKEAT